MLPTDFVLDAIAHPVLGDAVATTASVSNPLVLLGAAIAWAALIVNLVVVPFYNKPERLHLDYYSSGKINAAISAIEANELIPTLAQMFNRAMEARPDRRTKVDMESLLQEVQFIPHLEAAQEAMSSIAELRRTYSALRSHAGWLWIGGLVNCLTTVAIAADYVYLVPLHQSWKVLLNMLFLLWAASIVVVIGEKVRFFRLMSSFNRSLERHGDT